MSPCLAGFLNININIGFGLDLINLLSMWFQTMCCKNQPGELKNPHKSSSSVAKYQGYILDWGGGGTPLLDTVLRIITLMDRQGQWPSRSRELPLENVWEPLPKPKSCCMKVTSLLYIKTCIPSPCHCILNAELPWTPPNGEGKSRI